MDPSRKKRPSSFPSCRPKAWVYVTTKVRKREHISGFVAVRGAKAVLTVFQKWFRKTDVVSLQGVGGP